MTCRRVLTAAALLGCLTLTLAIPAVGQDEERRPVYTLAECINIALDGSAMLAITEANADIARLGKRQAWGTFLPDLSLSRTYNKSERTDFGVDEYELRPVTIPTDSGNDSFTMMQQFVTGELIDQNTESTYQDFAVNANWNIFNGFGKFAGLKSAAGELQSAEASDAYTRQLVIQYVAVAYIKLLRDERLLEVALESEDLARRELEKSETYHRIGSAAKSDVLQAKVRLGQTTLDVIRARNAVEQSFADLAHAMNRPLAERFNVDSSLMDTQFELSDLKSLFDEAHTQRLDLQSKSHLVDARAGDVTQASASLWPRLDVFMRYTRYVNESPFRFGAQESDNLAYGYQLNWNIFDRLQTWTNRSQAKARKRIAEYNLDQSRLDVQLEVRQIYNTAVEARERVSLARETIANAEEELRLAQERFRVGAGTTLEKITAQVNLASAKGDEVQATSDFLVASLQLERAVGRQLDSLLGE